MNGRDVVRRLRAFHKGRPLPRGSTIHHAIAHDEDLLILVFVKLGGESRPWAVAWGHPGEDPNLLTVPEGRDRTLVSEMMVTVAPHLLRHFSSPPYESSPPRDRDGLHTLRQIWLPNTSHLDMLHQLAYAYTFTKAGEELRSHLNALGRVSAWLHREAHRPGHQHVMLATHALRSAFTFPAEDMRQGHLGFLLTWLEASGGREQRLQDALEAEANSMSTALDPALERDDLEPLLDAWRSARDDKEADTMEQKAHAIEAILHDELLHRYHLTERAIRVLRADPRDENAGVRELVKDGLKQQWQDFLRTELIFAGLHEGTPYVPSVETDRHPIASSQRYHRHQASQEKLDSLLIHDDADLLAEAIADGEAFEGTIADVWDEGEGRKTVPVWAVHSHPMRNLKLRAGSRLSVVGLPNRTAMLRTVDEDTDGTLRFELVITNLVRTPRNATGKLLIPATDPRWEGEHVAFCNESADGIHVRKAMKIWNREAPGAWLTHSRPGGALSKVDTEDADDSNVVQAGAV